MIYGDAACSCSMTTETTDAVGVSDSSDASMVDVHGRKIVAVAAAIVLLRLPHIAAAEDPVVVGVSASVGAFLVAFVIVYVGAGIHKRFA